MFDYLWLNSSTQGFWVKVNLAIKKEILSSLIASKINKFEMLPPYEVQIWMIIEWKVPACSAQWTLHRGRFCQFPFWWIYYYNRKLAKRTSVRPIWQISGVFRCFQRVPPLKWWKLKLFKWYQILKGFRKSKNK